MIKRWVHRLHRLTLILAAKTREETRSSKMSVPRAPLWRPSDWVKRLRRMFCHGLTRTNMDSVTIAAGVKQLPAGRIHLTLNTQHSTLTKRNSHLRFSLTVAALVILLLSIPTFSRLRAAFKVGLNFSGFGLHGKEKIFTLDYDKLSWNHLGYSGSIVLGYNLDRPGRLNMEWECSLGYRKYARYYPTPGQLNLGEIEMLKFPVSIGYRFPGTSLEIFLGGYYAFRLNYRPGRVRDYTNENTEKIEKNDAGIMLGLRLRQVPIVIELRGNYGLKKFINEYRWMDIEVMLGIAL